MLRRLIDVLCIAAVAAVIAFAVMGRGEYVSAVFPNGIAIFPCLNIPNGTADTKSADNSANREIADYTEEFAAPKPLIITDGGEAASDSGGFVRFGHPEPNCSHEYIDGTATASDTRPYDGITDDIPSADTRSTYEGENPNIIR